MKMLLVWPYFYPEPSAAAVRGNAFARYLKQQKIQVEVVAPIKNDLHVENRYTYEEEKISIKVHRIPLLMDTKDITIFPISILKLKKLIKKINPDIIMSSSTPATITWQTAHLAKKLKIPFIMDVRDPYESSLRTASRKPIRHKIAYYVEKKSLQQAKLIFAVTPELRTLLIETYGITKNNIKIVTNGFDFKKAEISNETRNNDLVFIGSLTALGRNSQNIIQLLEKIKKTLPNSSFKIIGCKHKDELTILLKKKQLQNNVHLEAPIAHGYQLPTKTYEYVAMGLPIAALGPKDGALKKFIEENEIGLYSNNENELTKKIISILENKDIWKKFHENALKIAKNYTREDITKRAFDRYIKPLLESVVWNVNNQ
jgi:glycosyltransferase involved in cell wall biosynthesis